MVEARNPRWADDAHSAILLEVMLDGAWALFVATPTDVEQHGVKLYAAAAEGAYGPVSSFVASSQAPLRYINKMTMIGRLTDDEGDQVQAAFDQAPGRMQLMYAAASVIDTQDANFHILHDFVAGTLGVDRANEILQPTE